MRQADRGGASAEMKSKAAETASEGVGDLLTFSRLHSGRDLTKLQLRSGEVMVISWLLVEELLLCNVLDGEKTCCF